MIEKKLWLIVTFHTTADAMAMERKCRAADVAGRLIPVPRSIAAGCGMAWRSAPELREPLEALLRELEYEGIYELEF